MLKKTTGGGRGGLMGCECDTQAPPSPFTRHSNGVRASSSSLLLSPRSLSAPTSLFSMDAGAASMLEQSKNPPPCSSPRNPQNGSSGSSYSCGVRGAVNGLAAVLVAGDAEREYCWNGRVLLGMRLRVQLPSKNGFGGGDLPSSPIEFGLKNRDSQLALLSPVQRSPLSSAARAAQSEVERAEDYTCVIARGANPKMIHIFDDRVVESCAAGAADCRFQLSSCYGCKKRLGQCMDAPFLQHRGEDASCSNQCRYWDVLHDERNWSSPDALVKLNPEPFEPDFTSHILVSKKSQYK